MLAKLKIENKYLSKTNNENESIIKKIIEKVKKGELQFDDLKIEDHKEVQ